MEEKVLCKANIKGGCKNIILIIYTVVVLTLIFLPLKNVRFDNGDNFWSWGPVQFYSGYTIYNGEYRVDIHWSVIYVLVIMFLILIFSVVYQILVRINCTKCNLTLTENKIYGAYKWGFKNESIQIPMEKLDNIIIRNNFWDKIRGGGGSTLRIASNSGFVNFPCVQNAKEFTDLALKQLELFRKSNESSKDIPVASADRMIVDKLQSLQKLKEQGILSEAEYENKKAELIAKL